MNKRGLFPFLPDHKKYKCHAENVSKRRISNAFWKRDNKYQGIFVLCRAYMFYINTIGLHQQKVF